MIDITALSYLSSTFKSKFTPKEVAAKEAATSEYAEDFFMQVQNFGIYSPYDNVYQRTVACS